MVSLNRGRSAIIAATKQNRRRISIASALALSFGTLVSIAVLAVLGVSLFTGLTNTRDLLVDKATAEMGTVRSNLTNLFDPAENQVRYIANLIYESKIDVNSEESLNQGLLAGLAGSQHITGLAFAFPDQRVKIADRRTRQIYNKLSANNPVVTSNLKRMQTQRTGSWSRLIYSPEANETVMSFSQPIYKNDVFIGAVFAAIPLSAVNKAFKQDGVTSDEGRFILYGKDHVLTHQGFEVQSDRITYDGVVPKLTEIKDPVLASIWTAPRTPFRLIKLEFEGHFTTVNGQQHQFFYTSLEGYTDKPLIIGYRVKFEEATREIRRLGMAAVVGIIILGVSILIAFIIGRKIARPVIALSDASQKISSLDFASVEPLRPSRLKELNDASEGYNTMLRGLKWFENYVPKSLVRKLMESGDAHSEKRTVTVMFTDIVSFTPMAENMPSEEVAELLNHHFELVTACIEAEGGTVDKFIGDAVMAFWGAPDHQNDHATRACRAAKAIREAIVKDNKERIEQNKKPIEMRIGIHTGPLVVGNIGSSGRINYTVVGDTVNIAQRIEQLGKKLSADRREDAITLLSSDVIEEAEEQTCAIDAGMHSVKGRDNTLKIYRMTDRVPVSS